MESKFPNAMLLTVEEIVERYTGPADHVKPREALVEGVFRGGDGVVRRVRQHLPHLLQPPPELVQAPVGHYSATLVRYFDH